MEYLGFALLAVLVVGGSWWVSRLMSRTERNDDFTPGGGYGGMADGV